MEWYETNVELYVNDIRTNFYAWIMYSYHPAIRGRVEAGGCPIEPDVAEHVEITGIRIMTKPASFNGKRYIPADSLDGNWILKMYTDDQLAMLQQDILESLR